MSIRSKIRSGMENLSRQTESKFGVSLIKPIISLLILLLRIKGKIKVKKIENAGKYLAVYFYGIESPLYWPKKIDISSLYQVAGELMYPRERHYYEKHNTKVGTDDIVVDCGAAEGLFSLLVSQRCRKVYIIEPNPDFIEVLKLTFKDQKNIEVLPFALGEKGGFGKLLGNNLGARLIDDNSKEGASVKRVTIDSLFYDKHIPITYLKADIEGFEMEMLRGAINTIKEYTPKIAITVYHKKEHESEIKNLLVGANPNYKIISNGSVLHAWNA